MAATDFQTRKLNLITYIAELKDEKFFEKIENYILNKNPETNNSDLPPFLLKN